MHLHSFANMQLMLTALCIAAVALVSCDAVGFGDHSGRSARKNAVTYPSYYSVPMNRWDVTFHNSDDFTTDSTSTTNQMQPKSRSTITIEHSTGSMTTMGGRVESM